ncbi:hypothetical protein GCM10008985_33990 [Halococcus dombrowskii]|uniref:Uncharacterized protein n=1 Tax=Halococcus dombrowskii TaxID=179637 RepID=A0AAV3SLL2_HALDO
MPTDRVDGSIGLPSSYGSIEMTIPARQRANPPTTPKKRQLGLVGPAGSSENTKMYAELRAIPAPPIERRITGSDGLPSSFGIDGIAKMSPSPNNER